MKQTVKVVLIVLFVILAFLVMFYDAQEHIGFKEKPSMAFMEGMSEDMEPDMPDMLMRSDMESEHGGT